MSDNPETNDERPCLHCLIADTIDMDEIISALGKTIADMTYGSDAALRRRILEDLTQEIAKFEAEYANTSGTDMRH